MQKQKKARKAKKDFLENDIQTLHKKAQAAFNAWIRKCRDKNEPCISCGYSGDGRQWHAGHYRSQGGNSALRYDERNVNKQCSICNNYKSGNLAEYRKALVDKIGIDQVEELESTRNIKRWSAEELREIIKKYSEKLKSCDGC